MLRALTPQEDLHSSDNPPVCEWLHQGYGCWPDCTSISLACLIVSFPSSYPLLWTVFSISVQLILKGDHSMRTVLCLVAQSYLTLCDPTDCSPPGSSVHGILQARILEWVDMPSSRASSQPRDQPRSPTLQADSLPAEPQGKPENTGVGSLSLLQGIFPIQGLNPGLLHCRRILHQLSHKGSRRILEWVAYPFSRGSSRPRN